MRVGVIGFGLMGRQIAQVFIQHGHLVHAADPYPDALKDGIKEIESGRYGLDSLVSKGKISIEEKMKILSRIQTSPNIEEACKDAELVIEAAIEDLSLKQILFARLDKATNPDSVLASNTSTLSISAISHEAKNKQRILGMHFFNPAQVTKLVEIVQGRGTSSEKVSLAFDIVKEIGKTPILARDEPGFIANRLGLTLYMEASRMLEDKQATVKDIDTAMRLGYGHTMGPFETADIVGLDTRLRNIESLYQATDDTRWLPPRVLREMVNQGYLGDPTRKKGSKGGYYEYHNIPK